MMKCTLFNNPAYINKINNHIVTLSRLSKKDGLYEVSIDCFVELPKEENIDITDQVTDVLGSSIAGTIPDLLDDNDIDSDFYDFISKASELLK